VRTFLRWAVRKKWLAEDLTPQVEIPDLDDEEEPNPYTPGEARRILLHCAESNLDLCRTLAIRFFAGLRTSEAQRGGEERILQGYIEVTRSMTKTRRRRLVTIQPNLAAWLHWTREKAVWRSFGKETIREAIEAAGVVPRDNGTRSGFITHHVAAFENIAKTAKEAGNSEAVIERAYKGLATKEAGLAYFAIYPPADAPEVKPRANAGWFKKR
jgi:integrase